MGETYVEHNMKASLVGSHSEKQDHPLNYKECGELDEEDSRLKEMAEILEFKRRKDTQKFEDDRHAFEERKKVARKESSDKAKKLEDEDRIAHPRLDEEASLLAQKSLEDERKIDQALGSRSRENIRTRADRK